VEIFVVRNLVYFKQSEFNSIKPVWNNFKFYFQQLHFTHLCKLEGTNYELPEDDTIVSKQSKFNSIKPVWNNFKFYFQQLHFTHLCKLEGTNYELPEDDTIVSKQNSTV